MTEIPMITTMILVGVHQFFYIPVSPISFIDIDTFLQDNESTGKDFLPFPDKTSALLFLLWHSPRPMVCANSVLQLYINYWHNVGRGKLEVDMVHNGSEWSNCPKFFQN